jgi:hypothetical protein
MGPFAGQKLGRVRMVPYFSCLGHADTTSGISGLVTLFHISCHVRYEGMKAVTWVGGRGEAHLCPEVPRLMPSGTLLWRRGPAQGC